MQIYDYTHSDFITVHTGTAKIQKGTFKIIHLIDIELYEDLLTTINSTIQKQLSSKNAYYPILSNAVLGIESSLKRLKLNKRISKRSLDFIGSAWKWIAGNPDHRDHEIVVDRINGLLENNNDQLIINRLTADKINELTNRTNEIVRTIKTDQIIANELALNIKYKLEILKEELTNIAYAIHWAKANIINSFVLADRELDVAKEILIQDKFPFINIDEALEFAEVKVAADEKSIIYIISLPTTEIETFSVLEIRSVKKRDRIKKINFKTLLKNKNKIYGIEKKCKNYNNLLICANKHIVDVSKDTCIANLLESKPTNCTQVNSQHLPSTEEISKDLLFINNYNGVAIIDNEETLLNGTFIIRHHNSTITIEGRSYETKEVSSNKPLPSILQQKSIDNRTEEVLSLQMIKEINTKNMEHINLIETGNKISLSMSGIIASAILLIAIIALAVRKYQTPKLNNQINLSSSAIQGLNKIFEQKSDAQTRTFEI